MLPTLELRSGVGKVSTVHNPQKGGTGKTGTPEIEDKIDHGVELVLIDVGGNQLVHATEPATSLARNASA